MKSIKQTIKHEIEINKSRFINYLIPVHSLEDVERELVTLKKTYPDANHHCTAYIIGVNQEVQKYKDDGEPSRTAGLPMLEVLKQHDLTDVLNVSIRYFGGIKLGAGGLVRAYTKSCAESVKLAEFSELTTFIKAKVSISFNHIGQVEKYIRDEDVLLDTLYDSEVHYMIEILESKWKEFQDHLTERTSGQITFVQLDSFERYT